MEGFEYLPWHVMTLRLLMAGVAGALVGQERERHEQAAGLRTHLLVSAGACVFTMASIVMAGKDHDKARIAAQIVTGIGFLGAGTIIRYGGSVRGLTTAASIWSVAAVGMASGMGWWQMVIAATVLLYASLTCLKMAEDKLFKTRRILCLHVEMDPMRMSLPELRKALVAFGHEPESMQLSADADTGASKAMIDLPDVKQVETADIIDHVAQLRGVKSVRMA